MTPDGDLDQFIRERMIVSTPPGIPEIRLYLAGPSSGLARRFGEEAAQPYWAFAWGGGLALARHVLDRAELVAGRRVLDLGAGSGLVAVAAMTAGAASAAAADVDPRAAAAVRLNAELNGVEVATVTADLLDGAPPGGIDVVLVGDLFYQAGLAGRTLAFLRRCREAGLEVRVGDPGRATFPAAAMRRVGPAPERDFGGDAAGGGVYRLR